VACFIRDRVNALRDRPLASRAIRSLGQKLYRAAVAQLWQAYQVMPSSTWASCVKTGYPALAPDWLAVWLLIIADNIMHGLALKYL